MALDHPVTKDMKTEEATLEDMRTGEDKPEEALK